MHERSMAKNLTHKILEAHLVKGKLVAREEIAIKIDHTLLQDATGTMAMLEFESLGIDAVKVEVAVQYVDHNMLQTDNKNADDHRYLQTACARYGIHFSPPGNGVSHQVHMERFGVPGKTLLGADSHTPGAAGVSMLGIGAGGLDVAMAMAGQPYHLPCPEVFGVRLTGALPDWVSAKDLILEMLRRYGVKGCVGKVIEYYGPGVKGLSATDRETIGNMGTELGATSTLFPSDENTRTYLAAQDRGEAWASLFPDDGAAYDEYAEIELSALEPLIARPSSPGNVVPVRDVAGLKVDQAIIGSSVNSSFRDLMVVAKIMEGRHRHWDTSLHINPGSKQVLENIAQQGGIVALLMAGARIHESGCLGCIGMGQAPGTGQVSLRTFPRNFPGRSGTKDDRIYLCSPETAAAAALKGVITDPRDLSREMPYPRIQDPKRYLVDRISIIIPSEELRKTEVARGAYAFGPAELWAFRDGYIWNDYYVSAEDWSLKKATCHPVHGTSKYIHVTGLDGGIAEVKNGQERLLAKNGWVYCVADDGNSVAFETLNNGAVDACYFHAIGMQQPIALPKRPHYTLQVLAILK